MNIVVCDNYKKYELLKEYTNNKIINNNKFYTFNELKKKIYYDYNYKTIEYIINKYHVNIDIAKIYLENMYFLKDIDSNKVKFLYKLKKELIDNNLLIINSNFKKYITNKEIIVYKDRDLNNKEKLILKGLNYQVIKDNLNKEYKHVIYEAKDIYEEIEFVLRNIVDLINKGINLSNIKLIINKEYNKYIEDYFKLFRIPINIDLENNYYSTIVAKEFLRLLDNYNISEAIDKLKDIYDVSDLIKIINKSSLVRNEDIRKSFIIRDLKSYKIKNTTYKEAVEVCTLNNSFNSDDYVFLLGFNLGSYPYVYLDEDYFSDLEKELLGLDTSTSMNKEEKIWTINKIKSIPNLVITYKLFNDKVCYKSVLCELIGDTKKIELDEKKSYSKILSELKYAISLDNLYKYNEESKYLKVYQNNLNIPYREYNNNYMMVNKDLLKEVIGNELTLSYTSFEVFNECKFKYYLSNIMKINIYEDSFKTIIGNITHHILEIGINNDIDIEKEISDYIKDVEFNFTSREHFYLSILKEELEFVLNYLKEVKNYSSLDEYLFENEFNITKEYNGITINFKGFIDKIMKKNINNEEVIAVVDYKTGDKNITLDLLNHGINIQLPIYLYLLKKSDTFKDSRIAGFYLERVLQNILKIDYKKSLEERKRENLRLNGYTSSNESIIKLLDNNYQDSKMIKGLRFKKDGTFYDSAKVLSDDEMEDIVLRVDKKINEVITDIVKGDFSINPKVYKNNNISCTYCHFKDICFKKKENEVIIGGSNESNGRTELSS